MQTTYDLALARAMQHYRSGLSHAMQGNRTAADAAGRHCAGMLDAIQIMTGKARDAIEADLLATQARDVTQGGIFTMLRQRNCSTQTA